MKTLILLVPFIILNIFATAQVSGNNSITGIVTDAATKKPLEYGTVTVYIKGNSKPVTGTTTNAQGSFTLTEIPAGTFNILFENLGYQSYTLADVKLDKKDGSTNLKIITLTAQKNTLAGVTVVAQSKLIENKIDKMIFNAEKDVTSQGGVATDILKKIPQVSIDADGNVQLSGNSGIRFLINGKPSSAFGSNVADVLQSIPASQIKTVEVITNPGAKYDAQGLGGIINIILKTSNSKGYNGNLSVTAGTRNENGSFNFNLRNNNFGIKAFVSGSKRLPSNELNSNTRITNAANITSILDQQSVRRFQRQGIQTGLGFDWTVKKVNSFSGNISYNYFSFDGSGYNNQSLLLDKNSGAPGVLTIINSGNKYLYNNIDASLNYKRKFAKEDQELEVSITGGNSNNSGNSFAAQYAKPQDSLYFGTKSYNPAKIKQGELAVDYTQPFANDVKLGVGSKVSLYDIGSTADVSSYQPASKNYYADKSLSNSLNYKQQVYAVYAELTFKVTKLFDAKLGGRYERTAINAYYSNAQQQVKVPGYNTFVPSVFLSKKLDENQTIKLSFSKRIERPDYEGLNPFVNTTDPKNLSTGNPFLKPELGYRYELGYSKNLGKAGSFMANFFYRVNENDIQPYIVYYPSFAVGDSTFTNVAVSTRQNIGRENNLGLNLFADAHFTSKFNLRSNVAFFKRHTINVIDKGLNNNSFNYRINVNVSYQFANTLVAELFGNFNSPRKEAQGSYPSFTSYSTAIRKQFWKKKGSVALTATNPFATYLKQQTILYGPNFTVNGERSIPFRSIGINFTWKFGRLEFKKTEEKENSGNANAEQ